MSFVSRGFRGRRRQDADPSRVPPGQYVTGDFPVLSAGPTPHPSLEEWTFSIAGEVDEPRRWTWGEFRALPSEEVTVDIHCVTKWSKLDTTWKGVSVDTLLDGLETSAEYVVAWSATAAIRRISRSKTSRAERPGSPSSTTTSRSIPSTAAPRVFSSRTSTSGRARSGCVGSSSSDEDEPGFWEGYGYHNYGDPWREQRYWGD